MWVPTSGEVAFWAVEVTRRSLLQRALLILGIDAAGVTGLLSGPAAEVVSRRLSTAEVEDLVAFAEVLVEDRALTPAERGYLVEHIEDRTTRSPGYLALYRAAVSVLERLGDRRIASVEIHERTELVARHRLAVTQVLPGEDLGPLPEEMRTLRTRVVPDLIGGYYGSPAGWAAVGYNTFPGRRGDLTRYVRPER